MEGVIDSFDVNKKKRKAEFDTKKGGGGTQYLFWQLEATQLCDRFFFELVFLPLSGSI